MSELEITGLEKSYATQSVLRQLDLTVEQGTFVSILGPSGSGKTTLLRVIAGFERADGGCVRLRGEVVDDESNFVSSEHRRIGYVPQEGNLFPHLSVERNVGFGLAREKRRGPRVHELLEMVGLSGMAQRYPHQLSGGQQQRVALARGLAINPSLVLLDEPFSSLDATLRGSVRHDVRRILRDAGTTAILVTHDQDEALSLADRVAIIGEGQISQFDTPGKMYARPRTPELAHELGDSNFVKGVVKNGAVETPLGVLELEDPSLIEGGIAEGTELVVLIRPEQLIVSSTLDADHRHATVIETEFYGHDSVLKLQPDFDASAKLIARTSHATQLPARNAEVSLEVHGHVVAWRR
jgi:iron(III) transport system ATP-binding protein